MSTMDVYGMTDKLDNMMPEVMVTRLEARGHHPFLIQMLREYLAAMNVDSAKTVRR